jgi:hypothetical protein
MSGAISFNYPSSFYAFNTNYIVDISPIIIAGNPTAFQISPAITTLTFDMSNGRIYGQTSFGYITPLTLYTITASDNSGHSAITTITLGINFTPEFKYQYSPYTLRQNINLVPPPAPPTPPTSSSIITPSYKISNIIGITYSILYGALLPQGLILNTTNGFIYGNPQILSGFQIFTIRANNQGVIYDTTLSISVQTIPLITYPQQIYNLTQGDNVTIILNASTQFQTINFYSIDCTLPLGLNFNTQTGAITGTPTVLTPNQKYTISATNTIGSGTTSIIINIIKIFLTTPVLADNFSSNSFLTDPSLEMRRKAEIFQYKKNSAHLTKNQKLAQLARNNGPYAKRSWGTQGDAYTNPNISGLSQSANTLVCNSNAIICAPTSSSDVPGSIINLCYNPAVPLIGYNAPSRRKINVGFKWPQQAWRVGNNGFPVGKAGTDTDTGL